ncbi:uncharacterized protein RSE6_04364 [Rhynchosporium secalis]|uniref:Uncharacterized protein n=1 Tax=Rhynchosporium secalis TaxID=38038 RepID=A0A1E1M534_RHYSE|nr:uncharacterized protein RSE6_04364 [Rhynchosporium secalis]
MLFVIYEFNEAPTKPSNHSVFGTTEEHKMLETLGFALDINNRKLVIGWAESLLVGLGKTESIDLLPGTYMSIDRPALEPGRVALPKVYGPNVPALIALKKEYDSADVFSYDLPQLQNYIQ